MEAGARLPSLLNTAQLVVVWAGSTARTSRGTPGAPAPAPPPKVETSPGHFWRQNRATFKRMQTVGHPHNNRGNRLRKTATAHGHAYPANRKTRFSFPARSLATGQPATRRPYYRSQTPNYGFPSPPGLPKPGGCVALRVWPTAP